jgi:hypothetical protein
MPDELEQATLGLEGDGPRRGEYAMPHAAELEHCKSCGAQIVWARTQNDRMIPLSLATVQTRDGVQWLLPHFADCPHAKEWSRKR